MARTKGSPATCGAKKTPAKKKGALQEILDTNSCDPGTTLVEAQHAVDSAKKAKKRVRQVSLEAKVMKCIRDNFANFSEEEIYSKVVRGKTLYQKLYADKKAEMDDHDDSHISFGKRYFADVRSMYANDFSAPALDVSDDSLPCCPKLLEAVRASRSGQAVRDRLIQWLQTAPACNQTELVGLLSHLLELRPRLGGGQFTLCLEGWKYLLRHKMYASHPAEFACYTKQADRTLTQAWLTMKGKGFSSQNFWAAYRTYADMIVSVTIVDSLMAVKGSWMDVQGDLQEVAKTELGEAMFRFALNATSSMEASEVIGRLIDEQFRAAPITTAKVDQVRQFVAKEMERMPGAQSLNAPRVVELKYRGQPLKLQARSLFDEINLRIDCKIRDAAISYVPPDEGVPVLCPLFCELSLLPPGPQVQVVDSAVISQTNAARKCANESLDKQSHEDGAMIMQSVKENEEVYEMIDSSFRIELAWLHAMQTSGARDLLQQKVLDLMPDGKVELDPSEVAGKIGSLKTTPLYTFCGAEAQSSVNIAASWVEALANFRQPSLVGSDGPFLKQVSERMAFFLVHRAPANEEVDGKDDGKKGKKEAKGEEAIFFGKAAIPAKLADMRGKKGALTGPMLKVFSVYSWLLTDAQRTEVQDLLKTVATKSGSASASSSVAAESSCSGGGRVAKTGKKANSKAGGSDFDSTLALFKKRRIT